MQDFNHLNTSTLLPLSSRWWSSSTASGINDMTASGLEIPMCANAFCKGLSSSNLSRAVTIWRTCSFSFFIASMLAVFANASGALVSQPFARKSVRQQNWSVIWHESKNGQASPARSSKKLLSELRCLAWEQAEIGCKTNSHACKRARLTEPVWHRCDTEVKSRNFPDQMKVLFVPQWPTQNSECQRKQKVLLFPPQ